MPYTKHNSVGAGETPKLGRGKPEGLAQPNGSNKGSGHRVPKSSDFSDVGSPARPGGQQKKVAPAGSAPKVARPGGAQSANRGKR